MRWLQSQDLEVVVDPGEDSELGEDGRELGPVFMPDVPRFDPAHLAKQTDFIVCLGGDGELTASPPCVLFGDLLVRYRRSRCLPWCWKPTHAMLTLGQGW